MTNFCIDDFVPDLNSTRYSPGGKLLTSILLLLVDTILALLIRLPVAADLILIVTFDARSDSIARILVAGFGNIEKAG